MCFKQPSIPAAAPPPPVATPQDPAVLAAQDDDRRLRLAMAGKQGTILTSPMGIKRKDLIDRSGGAKPTYGGTSLLGA